MGEGEGRGGLVGWLEGRRAGWLTNWLISLIPPNNDALSWMVWSGFMWIWLSRG